MKGKSKSSAAKTPEHVIKCGQVAAHIHRRQSNTGFSYLDFSLNRSWTSQATGKAQSGSSFFDYNEADLVEAVRQVCRWIRHQNSQDGDDGEPPAIQETSD